MGMTVLVSVRDSSGAGAEVEEFNEFLRGRGWSVKEDVPGSFVKTYPGSISRADAARQSERDVREALVEADYASTDVIYLVSEHGADSFHFDPTNPGV